MKTKKIGKLLVVFFMTVLLGVLSMVGFGCMLEGDPETGSSSGEAPSDLDEEESEPIYMDATQLVSLSDGATVTACDKSLGSMPHDGLLISPANEHAEYSGSINGVFTGDLEVVYSFPGLPQSNGAMGNGRFVFRVSDAEDPLNYFELEIQGMNDVYAGVGVIDDRGNYRTIEQIGSVNSLYTHKIVPSRLCSVAATYAYLAQDNRGSSTFKLRWDGDVLNVIISNQPKENEQPTERVIAKFDGSKEINNDDQRWGLDKIRFEKGYIVSFASYDYGWSTIKNVLPVRFESVNGIPAGTETVLQEEWYREYEGGVAIEYEGSYKTVYKTTEEIAIKAGSFRKLLSPTGNTPVAKIEYSKDGGEYKPVKASSVRFEEAGEYTLRYTAVAENTNVGNERRVTFNVIKTYADLRDDIEITLAGNYVTLYASAEPPTVLDATFSYPDRRDEELKSLPIAKIEIKADGGSYTPVNVGDVIDFGAGGYTLRYTAVENGQSYGNAKVFEFSVTNSAFLVKNTFTVTSGDAMVTPAHVGTGTVEHNGLMVSASNGADYTGKINAYLYNDSEMYFSFPGVPLENNNTLSGKFAFKVYCLNNPDEYFKIWYVRRTQGEIDVYIEDNKGRIRATYDGTAATIYESATESHSYASSVFGMDNSATTYLKFRWDENGVLSVVTPWRQNPTRAERVIARFDGTTAVNNDKPVKDYGLDKLSNDFKNGYAISFESYSQTFLKTGETNVASFKLEGLVQTDAQGERMETLFDERLFRVEPDWYYED